MGHSEITLVLLPGLQSGLLYLAHECFFYLMLGGLCHAHRMVICFLLWGLILRSAFISVGFCHQWRITSSLYPSKTGRCLFGKATMLEMA